MLTLCPSQRFHLSLFTEEDLTTINNEDRKSLN